MIRRLPWHSLPTPALMDKLPRFMWRPVHGTPATEVAALMVYVALLFSVEPRGHQAFSSYDELATHTGLSRSLVGRALARLIEVGLIRSAGSSQKRHYVIVEDNEDSEAEDDDSVVDDYSHYLVESVLSEAERSVLDDLDEADESDKGTPHRTWYCKLPCRAIVSVTGEAIEPFQAFTLRSKHELNALKLYLYFAMVRPRDKPFSMATYETINAKTGVQERDIRRALSMLVGCGLLQSIDREHSQVKGHNEPNKYYLRGYSDLFIAKAQSTLKTTAK